MKDEEDISMLTDGLVLLGGWNTWLKYQPIFEYIHSVANSRYRRGDYVVFEGEEDIYITIFLTDLTRIIVQQRGESISLWDSITELREDIGVNEDVIPYERIEKTIPDLRIFGDIISPCEEEVHLFSVVYGPSVLKKLEKFYKVILSLNSLVTTGRGLPHEFL